MDILAGLKSVAAALLGMLAVAFVTVCGLAAFGQWGIRGVILGLFSLLIAGAFVSGAFNK